MGERWLREREMGERERWVRERERRERIRKKTRGRGEYV
jgi:hypothetical protein